jgi:chemotaxis protein methyltransferase CheR
MKKQNTATWTMISVELPLIQEVSRLVSVLTGVQLGEKQYSMVESRLSKRLMQLGIETSSEYFNYLNENFESESQALVSLLTTHHSFFFREFTHFDFLLRDTTNGLASIAARVRKEGRSVIRVWSSACSRGQEVYSLAMFLNRHLKEVAPDLKFEIVGSDVDSESIEFAKNGVFTWDEVKEIPATYMEGSWARGTKEISRFVRAKSSLRQHCKFQVLNLQELPSGSVDGKFDIIFCRNVFIYFMPEQIKEISVNLLKQLNRGGLLVLGLSETLNGLGVPVNYLGPSIYGAKDGKLELVPPPQNALPTEVLRVMCVDDSPTVLTLLKKILSPAQGFEVVCTAINGIDAAEKLKNHKIDIVTLDIDMPVQGGVEYLRQNFGPGHPPVVMLSSFARDGHPSALRSFGVGAIDYVEKPTLENLNQRGEEIRTKLRAAVFFAKNRGDK